MQSAKKYLHLRDGGDLLRIAMVLALVLGVIATHVVMRSSADLSPWKGGGFGMFSTIDSPGDRILKIQLHTDAGVVNVAAPSQLGDEVSSVLAAPSKQRLTNFAGQVANQIWVTSQFDMDALVAETDPDSAEAITDALVLIAESASVQAVDEELFDPEEQRKLEINRVDVTVYRLDAVDATDLRPVVLAQTTISNNSREE